MIPITKSKKFAIAFVNTMFINLLVFDHVIFVQYQIFHNITMLNVCRPTYARVPISQLNFLYGGRPCRSPRTTSPRWSC